MSQELYYTSAPRGLLPGKSGFCTVAATRRMGAVLMERLESLCSYRPLFPPHHPQASLNPVTLAHLRISVGGHNHSLLSRIGPAGLDYTGRTNVFAHHVVLEAAEQPAGGPAWLFQQKTFRLDGAWQGEARYLEPRTPPRGDVVPGPCREWQRVMGDAGWGGVLAERFEQEPSQVVYLIFEPGFDPLPLLAESLMLLPPERRWEVTFSTYYTGLPPGIPCVWRCVANGSEEAKKAIRLPGTINLCVPASPASGGDRVEQARTGMVPRRNTLEAKVQLSPSLMPPSRIPLPEKMVELETVPLPEQSRSRIWPFLTGMLAGMILMAGASGVMGYVFAVRPLVDAENARKELEVERTKLEGEIDGKKKEIDKEEKLRITAKKVFSKLPPEWSGLSAALESIVENPDQNERVVLDPLEKRLRSEMEKIRVEKFKAEIMRLAYRFFDSVNHVTELVCDKRAKVVMKEKEEIQREKTKRQSIINKIKKVNTNPPLGNNGLEKAINNALETDDERQHDKLISNAFKGWYENLFKFGTTKERWEEWLTAERAFYKFKFEDSKEQRKASKKVVQSKYNKIKADIGENLPGLKQLCIQRCDEINNLVDDKRNHQ